LKGIPQGGRCKILDVKTRVGGAGRGARGWFPTPLTETWSKKGKEACQGMPAIGRKKTGMKGYWRGRVP